MARAKQKQRTYARNRPRKGMFGVEPDGIYFLKLIIVMLVGMVWLRFGSSSGAFGVPIGLILGGLAVARYEKIQANRRIWYVVLLMSAILSFFLPSGIML